MDAPNSKEAEYAVMGSMLIDSMAVRVAIGALTAPMFYHGDMRRFFAACDSLAKRSVPADIVTVIAELKSSGLHADGDMLIVTQCIDAVATSAHIEYYCKIVASLHYDRQMISAAYDMTQAPSPESLERIKQAHASQAALGSLPTVDYKTGLHGFLDRLIASKPARMHKTGWAQVDAAWQGSCGGQIMCWAASTNTGKSLVLLNLMHMAAKQGRRCLYVGTEMSADETIERHLSITSGVDAWKIRTGRIDLDVYPQINNAISGQMSNMPVHILDNPEPTLEQVEAAIVASKAQVVYLDYLERFSLPKEKDMRLRVKEFMRKLKTLARRHDVEVHLAAQLNRTTYNNEEKRPSMADLSESSAIEKESDRVVLMWRPKAKQPDNVGAGFAVIECIQAKNRSGRRGLVMDVKLDERCLRVTEHGRNNESFGDE